LFAVDVPGSAMILDQALVMAGSMIFPLVLAPIAVHYLFGVPWYMSLISIFCIAVINIALALRQSRFFVSFKRLAAERTGLVSEWVNNIRTLRILGWIRPAEAKIFAVRKRETQNRLGMVTNGQVMNSVATSGTYVLNILAIFLLIKMREKDFGSPTPGELLSLLWILGVFLTKPLRQFPWSLVVGLDSLSSISRLQAAMNQPIHHPKVDGESLQKKSNGDAFALEIEDLRLTIGDRVLLDGIDLKVQKGECVAIVGEVGSGKSLLLNSIIGSTGARFKKYFIDGVATKGPTDPKVQQHFSFVPQEGFTMSASLRENILFTYLEDSHGSVQMGEIDSSVVQSLKFAQFDPSRERVSEGIETEIGERGVNLSGGQKQRISIARAHYADQPILLLDDCLSAVDVDTEARLTEKLFFGEWKDRTRLFSTQRMSILPRCDRILLMDNGKIIEQGIFAELFKSSKAFRDLIQRDQAQEGKSEVQPNSSLSDEVLLASTGKTLELTVDSKMSGVDSGK
jgi:ABC-type multidrug transport system fused ATPase/permease subunit